VDRRKKSRENREQLRCCNWIQLPTGPIAVVAGVPPAAHWLCPESIRGRHRKAVKAGRRCGAAQAS